MDDPSTYYTPLRMSRPWSPAAQPAGGGASGFSVVQTSTQVPRVVNAVDSTTLTFGSNVTAGNLMIVAVATGGGDLADGNVTDDLGNTYTIRAKSEPDGSTDEAIFTSVLSTGGSCTITINPTGSSAAITAVAREYTCNLTPTFDQANSRTEVIPQDTPVTATTSAFTPAQSGELVVICLTHTAGERVLTVGTNYTQIAENEPNTGQQCIYVEDRLSAPAGSQTGTVGISAFGDISPSYGIGWVLFKEV